MPIVNNEIKKQTIATYVGSQNGVGHGNEIIPRQIEQNVEEKNGEPVSQEKPTEQPT
jgi:hypothetical protein